MRLSFWLRWSGRDLRKRWPQVVAIALVIAVGTGVFAGLGSTTQWRRESNDASYAALGMHDIKLSVSEGSTAAAGRLRRLVDQADGLDGRVDVRAMEERLIAPTQVDASIDDEAILAPGRLVGVPVSEGGPRVDGIEVREGRALGPSDDGQPVGLLEVHFADGRKLAPTGALKIAGGASLDYVGTALSPEYFYVIDPRGGLLGAMDFAVVFAPLATVQRLTGWAGRVNDLVIGLRPGVDRERLVAAIEDAAAEGAPDLGITVSVTEDDRSWQVLHDDIAGDQQFWNVFAGLILAGAAFAAFNLAGRMVEAQRREIGVGMALGATPATIARRPLLVGLEIAVLGAVLGVVVGLLVDLAIGSVFEDLLPLPVWKTPFQVGVFVRGAALGVALPMVATAWPVWRAVRIPPVEAIRTGHLAVRGSRLEALARRLPVPGGSLSRLPLRNILRAPRRTLLTALGIASAITTLVATFGLVDSFVGTLTVADRTTLAGTPNRVMVELDRFHAVDSPEVRAIRDLSVVGHAETGVKLGGTLAPLSSKGGGAERSQAAGDRRSEVNVLLEVRDLDHGEWVPPVSKGRLPRSSDELLLAAEAGRDLGVGPGDTVLLRHPVATTAGSTRIEETIMRVAGLHPSPFRFEAFLARPDVLGLTGSANAIQVRPAPGRTVADVQRAIFGLPGVASVQPASAMADALETAIDQSVGIFRVIEYFMLFLAVLIAFNSTSIAADERSRDHATMLAFGLPVRSLLRLAVVEGLMVGLLGTAIGLMAGRLVVEWFAVTLVANTLPEVGITAQLSTGTMVSAVVLGVAAVAIAPLFTLRRLLRVDVPSTLRVME
ncbi:MAG: FtsX-like permease family protein [Actinobacteria bacterium]|nr:FtsX-like permease family protein [Actinomycetota bacterium]